MRAALVVLASALGAAVAGCAERGGSLEVRDAFAFAPPTPDEAAAYFVVRNPGDSADVLLEVRSDVARGAMLHRQVASGGRVTMEALDRLDVPPRDSAVLAPGGTHLMLVDLARLPAPGDTIHLTLRFARAGEVRVPAPVRAYGE